MSKMSEIYTACIMAGINPETTTKKQINQVYDLYEYFEHNIDYAIEAYKLNYTAQKLKSFGNYPPYWVYLLWVKK